MPLTTSVTPATIATALGQDAPESGSALEGQWQMWIDDALMLIQARVDSMSTEPTVAQSVLDYVIRLAVVARAERPSGGAAQVTTSVDDASVSRTYRTTSGPEVEIIGDWWAMLGLADTTRRAFMVDLMPPGAGEVDETDYWWWTP